MKIAMVSEHASPLAAIGTVDAGGQNVHVAALAAALARQGHEVVVHTRADDPGLPPRVRTSDGYDVEHVPAGPARPVPKDGLLPHMTAFGEHLARQWSRQRPDVVHAHFWMSGLAALPAAKRLGIPMAQTFHALGVVKKRYHGGDDPSPTARLRVERDLGQQAARVIASSSDEVFELARMGIRRARVSVVPSGVDTALFTPGAGPDAALPPTLLCVGRLVPRKGLDDAIRALTYAPGTRLVIAGGPPRAQLRGDHEARRLLHIAAGANVADRVTLLGAVPRAELPAVYRSAHVVLCLPWYEPFGIVPLEAMACGVPVVAAGVGGLVDTVLHGVTGLHVPARRPAAAGQAVRTLLGRPQLRETLGRNGVVRARAHYDWDRIATQTADVYAGLGNPRPRACSPPARSAVPLAAAPVSS